MTPTNTGAITIIKATLILLSAYNMSGTMLSAFQILSHFIPFNNLVWDVMLLPFFG